MFEAIWYLSVACTSISLILACYYDYKSRIVPVWVWKPAAYIGLPLSLVAFVLNILSGGVSLEAVFPLVLTAIIVVVITTLLGYFEIFGGADAIAMSLIALTTFYYKLPLNNPPPFMLVFINNWVVCLAVVIVIIAVKNIYNKNYNFLPWSKMWYMIFATRVNVNELDTFHGSVLEVIKEDENGLYRDFRPAPYGMRDTEFDTKKIVASPSFEQYKLMGTVWAMYYIPMIVPIAAAFFISLVFGDFNMMHTRVDVLVTSIIKQYHSHGIFGFKPF